MKKLWVVFGMAGLLGLVAASDAFAQCGWGRGRGWRRGQGGQAAAATHPPRITRVTPMPRQPRGRNRRHPSADNQGDANAPAAKGQEQAAPVREQTRLRLRDGSCGTCLLGPQCDGAPVRQRLRDGSCGACPLRQTARHSSRSFAH